MTNTNTALNNQSFDSQNIPHIRPNNTNNITNLSQNKKRKNDLPSVLFSVLKEVGVNSQNTFKSYFHHFEQMITHMFNKNNETITWDELESITYADMLNYRQHLMTINNSVSINSKLAGIKVIARELNKQNKQIDTDAFNLRKMPTHDDSETYGSFTEDEMKNLIQFAKELPMKEKGLIKSVFFKTAYVTAIRVGALLSLTIDQIEIINEGTDSQYALIKTRDKGKSIQTSIPYSLYEEIIHARRVFRIKESEKRVFPITHKTARLALFKYCDVYNIDYKERNLVLHSIKKASIDKVYQETGDINITARHGKHNSIDMVYEVYQGKNDKNEDQASLNFFNDTPIDTDDLQNLSKEELIELISKSGGATINKLKKML